MKAYNKLLLGLVAVLFATGAARAQSPTTWKKRVVRTIDMEMPEDTVEHRLRPADDDSTLSQMLTAAAVAGRFTVWEEPFTAPPTSPAQVKAKVAGQLDTLIVVDPISGDEIRKVRKIDFNFDLVHRIRIAEDWTFNPASGTTDVQIVAIAPIIDVYGDAGDFRGYKTLFWAKYADVRPVLTRYEQRHPANALSLKIWKDYFENEKKPVEKK